MCEKEPSTASVLIRQTAFLLARIFRSATRLSMVQLTVAQQESLRAAMLHYRDTHCGGSTITLARLLCLPQPTIAAFLKTKVGISAKTAFAFIELVGRESKSETSVIREADDCLRAAGMTLGNGTEDDPFRLPSGT